MPLLSFTQLKNGETASSPHLQSQAQTQSRALSRQETDATQASETTKAEEKEVEKVCIQSDLNLSYKYCIFYSSLNTLKSVQFITQTTLCFFFKNSFL